ncbi:ABC transporter permease [Intrasporangium chromatireducens]|uniref:ABC transporter permease n=1 Tax=Intrasporangium chromatireducens TaxID=1386088 RepID=UPI00138E54EA|nr:FtsX-like permease family protein [Intrasporangium chromatireducens]
MTRRLLAQRPVRTAAGALGIGLALMLMLLLSGLWEGVQQRITAYEDHLGADLVVVPSGTENLFADPGSVPAQAIAAVRRTRGVAAADPIRTLYLILDLSHGKAAVAAVASVPGGRGGPWRMETGRQPRTTDEVAVDASFADEHGVVVGDQLPVLGHRMRVVGLTADSAVFMTPLLFTTEAAMSQMLRAPGSTGALLLTLSPGAGPDRISATLRARGLTVRTPAQLHTAALDLATRIYGSPVRLMVAVAFAAGTLIVALVAHTRVSEQQRDLGVLKALGATPGRLRRIALGETASLTLGGAGAALLLLEVARRVLAWSFPSFPVVVTPRTLVIAGAAAAAMALLAAWLPARRLARLDPATAFRSRR